VVTVIAGFIFLFNFYFFRDPQRAVPQVDNIILSPADGKIIKIDEIDEPLYFKEKTRMVSIFMSVFSVHVNRIPLAGKIEYLDYQVGKFLAAFDHKASQDNEQSIIGISNGNQKVLFKQIAGVIARRIVYDVKKGQEVKIGDRFGLIHYGSRVDIFLPLDTEIKVKLNDKVTSGETIIGEFK
jgi:phosphatidylserine decarboxylase